MNLVHEEEDNHESVNEFRNKLKEIIMLKNSTSLSEIIKEIKTILA